MVKLGVRDGPSVEVADGAVEGACEGTVLGEALGKSGAGSTRNTKSSTSEYCTSYHAKPKFEKNCFQCDVKKAKAIYIWTHPQPRHGAWLNGVLSVTIIHTNYLKATSRTTICVIIVYRDLEVTRECYISDFGGRHLCADILPRVGNLFVIIHVQCFLLIRVGPC